MVIGQPVIVSYQMSTNKKESTQTFRQGSVKLLLEGIEVSFVV